eukprot:CAMPEP_0196584744 /NCGR_PEP_ID=MMETSP1081-20130531/48319_1 /TAXON_ID=36882 /ORGANISM="Pyramimonas amylifera, Strain CCMP720" /LENGTH=145 /DNA_ID=CAMNT_0041906065 /DNA_START=233 /DNA_END=667 /DNA_ORIENTATION=+
MVSSIRVMERGKRTISSWQLLGLWIVSTILVILDVDLVIAEEVKEFPVFTYVAPQKTPPKCEKFALALSGGIRTLDIRLPKLEEKVFKHHMDVYAHFYLTNPLDPDDDIAMLKNFSSQPYVKAVVAEYYNKTTEERIIYEMRGTW